MLFSSDVNFANHSWILLYNGKPQPLSPISTLRCCFHNPHYTIASSHCDLRFSDTFGLPPSHKGFSSAESSKEREHLLNYWCPPVYCSDLRFTFATLGRRAHPSLPQDTPNCASLPSSPSSVLFWLNPKWWLRHTPAAGSDGPSALPPMPSHSLGETTLINRLFTEINLQQHLFERWLAWILSG